LQSKQIEVVKILLLILARPLKEILEKLKFFNKKDKQMKESTKPKTRPLYGQALASKVDKILKLKADYPNLSAKKIENIHNVIKNFGKVKLQINMTMKEPSRKQIIISIDNDNKSKFMTSSSIYIANINSMLKNIKSEVRTDFARAEQLGIVITMNKVTSPSDFQTIENYIKNAEHINSNEVDIPHLPQLKFYLKIIGIPYLMENTNTLINSSVVKIILKNNYIFNNILLASKPYIVKVSLKSDMVIVWLDIWNVQSSSKAKGLINRCFNIGNYIMTIQGANMNSEVP